MNSIQKEIINHIKTSSHNVLYIVLANTRDLELVKLFKYLVVPFGIKCSINDKYSNYEGDWKSKIDESISEIKSRNPYFIYLNDFSVSEIIRNRFGWRHFNENYYSFRGQYRPSDAGEQYIPAEIVIQEEQIVDRYRADNLSDITIGGLYGYDILKLDKDDFIKFKYRNNLTLELDKELTKEYEKRNKTRLY